MSETVDLLLAVQGLDGEMVDLQGRLQAARAALGEPPELQATRAELRRVEDEVGRLSADQRAVEAEVANLTARAAALEKRLYGQEGTNTRTIAPLQKEIEFHRGHIRRHEDTLVELMVALDGLETERRRLRDSVVALEALHAGRLPELQQAVADLEARRTVLTARRAALAGRVPAPALQVYQTLAASKRGRPVVRLTGGTCHGCGVTLATAEAQRVRQIPDLPRCPRCGHILKVE